MKIKLNKTHVKNLSTHAQDISSTDTPNIAGGQQDRLTGITTVLTKGCSRFGSTCKTQNLECLISIFNCK